MTVSTSTGGAFTDNVADNEKMVTNVIGQYMKLVSACSVYMNKKGRSD